MKRLELLLFLAALCSIPAGAETTAAAGGGVTFDTGASTLVTPVVVATLTGDLPWLPTDRIGAFLDWSAAGSYEPVTGTASGLAAVTASTSYVTGEFLGKLSVSSVASLSTVDPFYGAASTELLLSYGGPSLSVFAAPRFSLVDDSGVSMDIGGNVGVAALVGDSLLLKPHIEAGVSVPGGLPEGWYFTPSLLLTWYAGGGFTFDMSGGFGWSYSTKLTSLVVGGQPLPLNTYRQAFLSGETTWVGRGGMTVTASLPVSYTDKTYNAFAGSIDLGVPAWLLDLQPTLQLTVPMADTFDLVFTLDGTLDFSNNSVEQSTAVSATTQLQLHLR